MNTYLETKMLPGIQRIMRENGNRYMIPGNIEDRRVERMVFKCDRQGGNIPSINSRCWENCIENPERLKNRLLFTRTKMQRNGRRKPVYHYKLVLCQACNGTGVKLV